MSCLEKDYKHYGLKLISKKEEINIIIEYSNIIWNYKFYYSSFKKRYTQLVNNDDRWNIIEAKLLEDLKCIGLEGLKEQVISFLKNKDYFEYKNKSDEQFKNYCIPYNLNENITIL